MEPGLCEKQMFKMNPAAKEFVPAHLLKKRQEATEELSDLTQKLDQVDLKSNQEGQENAGSKRNNSTSESQKEVQGSSSQVRGDDFDNSRPIQGNKNSTSSNNQQINNHTSQEAGENGRHINNNNNHNEGEYPEGLQELIDEEDDRFLLNAGEDLCEFNGEQFIIPGDDYFEPPAAAGYDFGNAEDNEDEDVCNAFEEFLGNLPSE